MIKVKVEDLSEAFVELNLLFTNRTNIDAGVTHNSFRNDHFMNAFNIVMDINQHHHQGHLEEIGYSKNKILHLIKSYLHPEEYQGWLGKIKDTTEQYGKVDSDIGMQTTANSKHGNGPCLFGFSFRSHIEPVLTVYSRSVELPQTYFGDTLLVSAMAQQIADVIGADNIKVVWYIASARIKSRSANFFKLYVYPFAFSYRNEEFQRHVDKQWNNILADQDKQVSFSKLVKLQQEYKRVVIDQQVPDTKNGVYQFMERLSGTWNIKGE
jgi:hypothetical protein